MMLHSLETMKIVTGMLSGQVRQLLLREAKIILDTLKTNTRIQEDKQLRVTLTDSLTLEDGSKRKRLVLRDLEDPNGSIYGDQVWVEGIGNLKGLLTVVETYRENGENDLLCYSENEQVIYQNAEIGLCWVPTSIEQESENIPFHFYPNPTSGHVTIELPGIINGVLILRDVTGQVVLNMELDSNKDVMVDLGGYHYGMYLVEVVNEGGERFVEKLVVVD